MTRQLFRHVFGGRPVPNPELTEALGELERLNQDRSSLATATGVLRDVLPALFGQAAPEIRCVLTPERGRDKLAAGTALLHEERLNLDRANLNKNWLAVCGAVERHQGSEQVRALAGTAEALDPCRLLNHILAGRSQEARADVERLQLDASLTLTVLRLAALPALARLSATLATIRKGASWDRGSCPSCGSGSLLGELRGLEQLRYLRCGWCAAGWEFPRLRCPWCDCRDHRQLGYFHAENEQDRASTCDACQGYVKMCATLSALSAPMLLVRDLASVHLDLVAADRGYKLP